MYINPLNAIDFYKADHRRQYPHGTEYVYSNFTPRSARHAIDSKLVGPNFDNKVVFVGLQGFCRWFLRDCFNQHFFSRPKVEVVAAYKRRMDRSLGEGAIPVEHIAALHDLQYLPIMIKAVPEGTRVPIGVPMLTIENTDEDFFWLTNYLETVLSNSLWKACTEATIAYEYRKLFKKYAVETGGNLSFVDVQGHDFSARGMSTIYDAASSGIGHLLSFVGTDTVSAIDYAEHYYGGNVIGVSVPATEHSVMSMGGREDEISTFQRLIQDLYPSGIVSIVSDTWNFWTVITEYAARLKDIILNRTPDSLGMAKVVFRPDSGDPVKIICGDPEAPEGSPARKGAVQCLWDIFGGTTNASGYRTINQCVGLIYGDSITYSRASEILERLKRASFASDNIVFGIGSYTYQYVTRDTFGFAMKSTWGRVLGEPRELSKDPITDDGTKKSLKGLLKVIRTDDGNLTVLDQLLGRGMGGKADVMDIVFFDGEMDNPETFDTIKRRLCSTDER
jgi:nicotinamide phosphoribosyltransferase